MLHPRGTRRIRGRTTSTLLALAALGTTALAEGERTSKFNKVVAVGDEAPSFSDLPGADGKTHSLADYKDAKAVVLVFSSTQCGVVGLYESRIREFAKEYADKGVEVVAISCERKIEGELERLREREQKGDLPYDSLYDASQATGRKYGAVNTPTFFVLDGKRHIAYLGAFDDNFAPDGVEEPYLRNAVDAVLAGKTPENPETLARGCRIEYVESGK